MKASIQLHPADKRQTPRRERLPTNNVNQLSFGATLFSVPKAQNGQRHNSNMLYKVSEKLKVKSNLTHHVPDFVFLQTKPPSPNPLSFGNHIRASEEKRSAGHVVQRVGSGGHGCCAGSGADLTRLKLQENGQ